jgi:hypothetical protein
MIKDIIVNLEHRIEPDPARDFAISIAETFDAHVAGVSFAYTADLPGYAMLEIPSEIVAPMIAQSEKAALAAIERFEAAAKRSMVSAEHCLLRAIGASAPVILSTLARRFDLSVFMQSEPDGVDNNELIDTSLLQSGRPLIVVPYIQKDGLKLDLGWQPRGSARHQRCIAATGQGDDRRPADRGEREDEQREDRNPRR